MAKSAGAPGGKRRRDADHVRSLKERLLWEIALAIEARGLTDEAAADVTGERIETLENVLRGRYAAYGIVRLMRTLARLGVPVSLSVTPASTMLRAGERRTVIRYRRLKQA
jgi:transcriptional regulator with XRE-family HTH domain